MLPEIITIRDKLGFERSIILVGGRVKVKYMDMPEKEYQYFLTNVIFLIYHGRGKYNSREKYSARTFRGQV
jgi:hypothetical protein